jgi:hypothetical protein
VRRSFRSQELGVHGITLGLGCEDFLQAVRVSDAEGGETSGELGVLLVGKSQVFRCWT